MNGHRPAGGISALVKTIAKEVPAMRARVIDLDPDQPPDVLAALLFDELSSDDPCVEVGYVGRRRQTRRLVAAETNGTVKPGPNIGPDSVILLTGGARGITGAVAVALAERFRCRLELVGRSPLPEEETPDLAVCRDATALRQELAKSIRSPASIEAAVRRILAGRQIRASLDAIARAGGRAAYHACDVRDPAFGALIDGIYEREGRIDGVIHGAGVTEDKLLIHKTPESFDRVFDTKVRGAHILAERLRPDVGFVVFFASVAGAFGNPGQADYAAANDALDTLALHLSHRLAGRVVSIDWGPWAGVGMVTPELEREYARRGLGLIPVEEGVDRMLAELGQRDAAQVVIMHRSAAEVLAP
jgi:NAD(P)-dependent dehydrogenase (short-subunit alcohol dehydrogenase family)